MSRPAEFGLCVRLQSPHSVASKAVIGALIDDGP